MKSNTRTAVTNMTIKAEKKMHINRCKLKKIRLFAANIVEAYETSSSKIRFIVMFVTAGCVLFFIKLRWPKKMTIKCFKSKQPER